MKLSAIGMNTRHENGLSINRPVGSGDFLLVIFKTPAYVYSEGVRYDVLSDYAVLYPEEMPQIYGSQSLFINHWVHFEGTKTDAIFDDLQMQFGVPVPVAGITAAESILEMLGAEVLSEQANEMAEDLLLRLLFVRTFGTHNGEKSSYSGLLRRIRSAIYTTPAGDHSVKTLAQKASLSGTYFQTLYRQEFGISIGEDVIRSRIAAAQFYLKNTDLSITSVAELCGYRNIEHFIRQFHARTGMTASDYRQQRE